MIFSVYWHIKEDFLSLFYPIDKIMSDQVKGEQLLLFNSNGLIELDKPDFEPISEEEMKNKIDFSLLISSSLFVINRPINFNKVAEIWDNINLTTKEEVVLKALRIILPDVERLAFSISPGVNTVKLKIKNQQNLIPLSSMGDGMNRILTLAMALVSTEKGVLLIDEIETGLHYEAQLDMWRLVLKTAQDLDVQVFATTHSWDCIAAFKEALQELEDQSVAKLFRLDSKYGKLRAVEYDAEEIRIAVNQGVEVR